MVVRYQYLDSISFNRAWTCGSKNSPDKSRTAVYVRCCQAELLFGAYKSQRVDANLARLQTLFRLVHSLPFDADAANYFGKIRAFLHQQGTPIGPYDLQIAAIARARNLILVTHNIREFSRVPELICEDWVQ